MTVQDGSAPLEGNWSGDELIDIRGLIATLISWWREIAAIAILLVVVVGGGLKLLETLSPAPYTAASTVVILRTKTNVSLDERFTTAVEQTTAADAASRRAALVGLIINSSIAEKVIAELGDQLPPELRQPSKLTPNVTGELANNVIRNSSSDLILIQASADDPTVAALIADSWARHYVALVNQIYGVAPDDMIASVELELASSQAAYDRAQANLEAQLSTNRLGELQRQFTDKSTTLGLLRQTQTRATESFLTAVGDTYAKVISQLMASYGENQTFATLQEQRLSKDLVTAYINTYRSSIIDSFITETGRNRALLYIYSEQLLQVQAMESMAANLLQQLQSGGAGAAMSVALALQQLKIESVSLYASSTARPSNYLYDTARGSDYVNEPEDDLMVGIRSELPLVDTRSLNTGGVIMQYDMSSLENAGYENVLADAEATLGSLVSFKTRLTELIAEANATIKATSALPFTTADIAADEELMAALTQNLNQLFTDGPLSKAVAGAIAAQPSGSVALSEAQQLLDLSGVSDQIASAAFFEPMADRIITLENEMRLLASQVEAEQSKTTAATELRNLRWESFKALNNKLAELTLTRAAANSEVRIGTSAVAPTVRGDRFSIILAAGAAGMAGLILGIVIALISNMLGKRPWFSRRTQTA